VTNSAIGPTADISIDFSVEELVALTSALGLRLPAAIEGDPLADLSDRERALVLDGAQRGLLARQMLTVEEGVLAVAPAIARLLELMSEAGVIVRAQREEKGVVEDRFYAAHPDVTVEHLEISPAVYRLTPFPTEELLVRVLGRCELEDRPSIDAEPFTVTLADLLLAAERIAEGNTEKALAELVSSAGGTDSAQKFARALEAKVASARVAVLHAPEAEQFVGGDLTWLDGGEHGLWLTPTVEPRTPALSSHERSVGAAEYAFDVPMTIEPTSAKAIAAELLSYLPSAG
jgi:hypothetical protein